MLGDRLFKVNVQSTLVALEAKSGKVLWNTVIDDYKKGYSNTTAPLVVKDMIVVGTAGAEWGIRGYIDAYDAATGKRRWRFYTVPTAGEPGIETWGGNSFKTGGGSTWITGTYDPATKVELSFDPKAGGAFSCPTTRRHCRLFPVSLPHDPATRAWTSQSTFQMHARACPTRSGPYHCPELRRPQHPGRAARDATASQCAQSTPRRAGHWSPVRTRVAATSAGPRRLTFCHHRRVRVGGDRLGFGCVVREVLSRVDHLRTRTRRW